jgi:hypothetical protein
MLKRTVKRLIKRSTNAVRSAPIVLRVTKRLVAVSPGFNQWMRRILIASFAVDLPPAAPYRTNLTDAQMRVLLDLRDEIEAGKARRP